jgi:pilus assembly protein FimV
LIPSREVNPRIMGILDDAIREHLDLKRKHGARDAELREIEDEAFGENDQSDSFAGGGEFFGDVTSAGSAEVSTGGAAAVETPPPDLGNEEPTRLVEPEALAEPEPEAPSVSAEPAASEFEAYEPDLGSYEEDLEAPESAEPIPGQPELPGQDEIPGQERLDQPIEGNQPPVEQVPEAPSPSESLEELIAEEEPFPEDSEAPPPDAQVDPIPSADRGGALEGIELEEQEEPEPPAEPESAVPEPPPPPPVTGSEPPGRARGRIDVPTQEHTPPGETDDLPVVSAPEPEPDLRPELEAEPEPSPADSGGPALYDFESDEEALATDPFVEPSDEFDALGPADEEAPYLDEEEPYAEEPVSGTGAPPEEQPTEDRPAVGEPRTEVRPGVEEEEEEAYEGPPADPEESYEEGDTDDELWFEKGPPKDFDFD